MSLYLFYLSVSNLQILMKAKIYSTFIIYMHVFSLKLYENDIQI